MLWQVPVLSFTAQAFLFTIALGSDTSSTARVISSLLSLVITSLSIHLLARQRQAEIMDAHWLEEWDTKALGAGNEVHGRAYQRARAHERDLHAGFIGRMIPVSWPGFKTWVIGLLLFAVAAIVILVFTIAGPSALR
jgi:hypothetical protein